MNRAFFLTSMLACLVPAVASAQDSGWGSLGRALGHREQPAMELVSTSLTGPEASKKYGHCLESNAQRIARLDQDNRSAFMAVKGACRAELAIFYSAVYQDDRASKSHNSAVKFANTIVGRYEADVDARLPSFIIESRGESSGPSVRAPDKYERIARLKALLDSGALTQQEFDAEKARLLAEDENPRTTR